MTVQMYVLDCHDILKQRFQLYARKLSSTIRNNETSFLWGPRQVGKTTFLRSFFPGARYIDLLRSDEFRTFSADPMALGQELKALPKDVPVVIDEIQRVPDLLNEVQRLIESEGRNFILSGSSARKLKRGHGNLLGGRALRHEMFGLVSSEIGQDFDLFRAMNHGVLPKHYLSVEPRRLLKSYIADYLKEEIAAEGLTRNLPAFSDFLRVAAIMDTEIVNFSNAASECRVSQPTIKSYFEILCDTLLARFLPAYTKAQKRRVILAPKFYFSNVGVVNSILKRPVLEPKMESIGPAFENLICHEIFAHRAYIELDHDIAYWRTASGFEVDFILGDGQVAVECKAKQILTSSDKKGLRAFAEEFPKARKIVVCLCSRKRTTEDGIEITPAADFLKDLWSGNII